jgi:hypothetical protein
LDPKSKASKFNPQNPEIHLSIKALIKLNKTLLLKISINSIPVRMFILGIYNGKGNEIMVGCFLKE